MSTPSTLQTRPDQLTIERMARYLDRTEISANTLLSYQSGARQFAEYCREFGLEAMPASPETVGLYVAYLAALPRTIGTIKARLSAIAYAHRKADQLDPTASSLVRSRLEAAKRLLSVAPEPKQALTLPSLARMIATLDPSTLIGSRDRALLLIGFFSAWRRAELVALAFADVDPDESGLVLHKRRSKTDQHGEGFMTAIPAGEGAGCPVAALRHWLRVSKIREGPVFRPVTKHGVLSDVALHSSAVARIVKRTATAAGLDATELAGHSLRRGYVTAARKGGARRERIGDHTGQSDATVKHYTERADLFEDHPSAGLSVPEMDAASIRAMRCEHDCSRATLITGKACTRSTCYAIRVETGQVKIGTTTQCLDQRISSLKVSTPGCDPVLEGIFPCCGDRGRAVERVLHTWFADDRSPTGYEDGSGKNRGREWFRVHEARLREVGFLSREQLFERQNA